MRLKRGSRSSSRGPWARSFAACALLVGSGCATSGDAELLSGPVRVLILGDSISIGYTEHVRALLGEDAVVVRPTREGGEGAENCAGTSYGKDHIERWLSLDGGPFDVVHFNFGLHDLKRVSAATGGNSNDPEDANQAPLEVYAAQLRSITERLTSSGATVIFATTTPVPTGGVRPHRDPGDVLRYNAAAEELMAELGVRVNDLYSFALPRLEVLQRPVNVHFTRAGSMVLAEQVAEALRGADARLSAPSR